MFAVAYKMVLGVCMCVTVSHLSNCIEVFWPLDKALLLFCFQLCKKKKKKVKRLGKSAREEYLTNPSLQASLQIYSSITHERSLPECTVCPVALTGQTGELYEQLVYYVQHAVFFSLTYT